MRTVHQKLAMLMANRKSVGSYGEILAYLEKKYGEDELLIVARETYEETCGFVREAGVNVSLTFEDWLDGGTQH